MLTLLIGRAGSGKTARIFKNIQNDIQNGKDGIVLLVPDQYSHDAERQLCRLSGDNANGKAEVLSFSRMCSRVFAELGGAADKFLDEAGRILLMARAVDLASSRLKSFSSKTKKSEFIQKLVDTSREMKSSRISANDLIETSVNARPALRDKLEDTALILDIYNSFLTNDVKDPDERLDRLIDLLPDSKIGNGGVYIDGFYEFSAQQYDVITELLKKDIDITLSITCDTALSDEPVFHMSFDTISHLSRICNKSGVKCVIERMDGAMNGRSDALRHLEENLFSAVPSVYDGNDENIAFYKCTTMLEECENAASLIINKIHSGARYHDIAVAAGDIEKYSSILRSVFEKYEIPFYQNRKTDIMKLPPCLAIFSALRLINSGWDYENMFSYLKTGFAGISHDEASKLENYSITWDIRGKMWYGDKPWSDSPDGYDSEADADELNELNALRERVCAPLVKLQNALKSTLNSDRIKALFDFTEDIGLYEQIEILSNEMLKCGDREDSDVILRFGNILTDALEQFYSTAGDISSTLDEFIYQWELLLSSYDMGSIPSNVDSVVIGDMSRIKQRDIKHLIIIGMTDGDVPKQSVGKGVFSNNERDELILLKLGLSKTSADKLFGDITTVYESITMPSDSIVFSYPESDSSGSAQSPSYIFTNALRLFSSSAETPKMSAYKTSAFRPCVEYSAIYAANEPCAKALSKHFSDDAHYKSLIYAQNDVKNARKTYITPERAKALYGERISLTASRVDKYKQCRYSYFLQYGLKAKPRKQAKLDAATIGTFLHYLLENTAKEVELRGGFKLVSNEDCDLITKKYTEKFVAENLNGFEDRTARFIYLFNMLTEDALQIVRNMAEELRNSDFKPYDFELEFASGGEMEPYVISDENIALSVRGKVDRVDGWVHDDKLYLRVVDYKTGTKTFSLSDVWYGLGMQMLIYLFALKSGGDKKYNMEIVPAGVVYAPAKEVTVSGSRHMSDAELEKERAKKIKYSGLILNDDEVINAMCSDYTQPYAPVKCTKGAVDPEGLATIEQLGALGKHIDKVLCEITAEIGNGNITADPYFINGLKTSCTYCDYYNACLFGADKKEKPKKRTALKPPEVWTKIREELNEDE